MQPRHTAGYDYEHVRRPRNRWSDRAIAFCSVGVTLSLAACSAEISGDHSTGSVESVPGVNNPEPPAGGGVGTTTAKVDPGRVTIRRLNRVEYDNTVRDLTGTTKTFGIQLFPDDAPQFGFDNDGNLQTLSPVQFSLYQQAAEALAAEVVTPGSPQRARVMTCELAAGDSCKNTLIENFGLRAFRRPLTVDEKRSFIG